MTIQRLEELSPNFIPMMRILLAINLTIKGQPSNANEQLENLVKKVANIETGIKIASGSIISSSTAYSYENLGGVFINRNEIEVVGMDFEPSFIFAFYPSTTSSFTTIYTNDQILTNHPQRQIFITRLDPVVNSAATNVCGHKVSGRSYVNSSGFRIPVMVSNNTHNWFAIS